MMLYTPLAIEDIFSREDEQEMGEYVQYNGKTVYAQKHEDGSYQIQQLLSTNPNDFLKEEFMPGASFSQ